MATNSSSVRTASRTTRRFFEALETSGRSQADVSGESGVHVNTFYAWKTGKAAATVINMEAALQTMGLELIIRPIRASEPEELPL